MEVGGQHHALAALIPGKGSAKTSLVWDWVDNITSLDVADNNHISCSCRESNPIHLGIHFVNCSLYRLVYPSCVIFVFVIICVPDFTCLHPVVVRSPPLKRKINLLVTFYFVFKETVIVKTLPTNSYKLFHNYKLFALVYLPLCLFSPSPFCCYCL